MSHIEKLEALVKAGHKAPKRGRACVLECCVKYRDSGGQFTYDGMILDVNLFLSDALNARDSIAWALDVAKAARELRAAERAWDSQDDDVEGAGSPRETLEERLRYAESQLDAPLAKEPK